MGTAFAQRPCSRAAGKQVQASAYLLSVFGLRVKRHGTCKRIVQAQSFELLVSTSTSNHYSAQVKTIRSAEARAQRLVAAMTFVEGTVEVDKFDAWSLEFCLSLEVKDQQWRLRSSNRGVHSDTQRQVFEGLRDFKSMGPRVPGLFPAFAHR